MDIPNFAQTREAELANALAEAVLEAALKARDEARERRSQLLVSRGHYASYARAQGAADALERLAGQVATQLNRHSLGGAA